MLEFLIANYELQNMGLQMKCDLNGSLSPFSLSLLFSSLFISFKRAGSFGPKCKNGRLVQKCKNKIIVPENFFLRPVRPEV